MGLIPQRVYFDSCVVIYLVEEHLTFGPVVESLMATQSNNSNLVVQVSDLTEMECLVMPLRKSNQPLLEK